MGRGEQNGGLYEEEPTPKQHRRPERTLRYTEPFESEPDVSQQREFRVLRENLP